MAEKSNEKPSIGLRKDLNVLNCVSYHISMIIGAGIFIVPNVIKLKFFVLFSSCTVFYI